MRTVELLLNDELDGAVRAVWDRLAAAGQPSLAGHEHPTNRPHLTLATGTVIPPLAPILAGLPLSLTLDGLVFFEGKVGVLAWRVVADKALRELQAEVWHALAGQQRNPLHAPDRWVPHVSLARRPTPALCRRVLEPHTPAKGWFVGARSYDNATREVRALLSAR
jgi:hypothetical protein